MRMRSRNIISLISATMITRLKSKNNIAKTTTVTPGKKGMSKIGKTSIVTPFRRKNGEATKMKACKTSSVPPVIFQGEDVKDILNGLISTHVAQGKGEVSVVKTKYRLKQMTLLRQFIEYTEKDLLSYGKLTELVPRLPSFEDLTTLVPYIFVALSGSEDFNTKRIILNKILIGWFGEMRITRGDKAGDPHSPATLNTIIKTFLGGAKYFYGWNFSVSDFAFQGGYAEFFQQMCADRQKEIVRLNFFLIQSSFIIYHYLSNHHCDDLLSQHMGRRRKRII